MKKILSVFITFVVAISTMSCNSLGNYGNNGAVFVPRFNFAFVTNAYQTSDMAYMATSQIGPNGFPIVEYYPNTTDPSGQYRWHNIEKGNGSIEASIANMNTLHAISGSESEYQFTSMIRDLVRFRNVTEYEKYLERTVLIVTYVESPIRPLGGTQVNSFTNEIGGTHIFNMTGTFKRVRVADLYQINPFTP